jgi:peptidoglycan/LPS O-acetylase OafA/YrhL
VLFMLVLPTMLICEYGTLGLMFALCGYLMRHRERYAPSRSRTAFIVSALTLMLLQAMGFQFGPLNILLMAAVIGGVAGWLYAFRVAPVRLPQGVAWAEPLLRLTARYSLYFYALHLIALQIVTMKGL